MTLAIPPGLVTSASLRRLVFLLWAMAVVRGLRMPSAWAMTHYLFSYQHGFTVRALFGSMVRLLPGFGTPHYFPLSAVAFAVMALLLGLAVVSVRRLAIDSENALALLVFAASPAWVFMAHLVGYLEQACYVGVVLLLALQGARATRLGLALLLAAVSPMVHEASVLWTAPLVMLILATDEPAAPGLGRFRASAVVGLVWLASAALTVTLGHLTPEQVAGIRDEVMRAADFQARPDAVTVLSNRTTLAPLMGMFTSRKLQFDVLEAFMTFGPGLGFLTWWAWRQCRAHWPGRDGAILAMAAVAAVVAPLALQAIAWDTHRWWALSSFNAGIVTLVVARAATAAPDAGRVPVAWSMGPAVVLVWCLMASPVLFDGYTTSDPPYVRNAGFLIRAVIERNPEAWKPLDHN